MSKESTKHDIKEVYDQRPYPEPDQSKQYTASWSWVDIHWIESLLPQPTTCDQSFKRILIAGCGTGKEAFLMRNRFPNAEITAVDYSEQAITIAQDYQKKNPDYDSIHFHVGDLTQDSESWFKADYYDFISCHGVMSYIPQTQDAFNTLANCLATDGILYLGVNGATHIGVAVRQSIQHFGYAKNEFHDTAETRQLIELFDRMRPAQENISGASGAYLASDILNTFSHNLPLAEWLDYAQNSALHFISSTELVLNLSKTLAPNIFSRLLPKTRAEICEIIAYNNVAPFHRLIFSKHAQPEIPWTDFDALMESEFLPTRLYTIEFPISTIDGEITLWGAISERHEINFKWPIDKIIAKLLKPINGTTKLGTALEGFIDVEASNQSALTEKVYMLYQLGIIKILAPNK